MGSVFVGPTNKWQRTEYQVQAKQGQDAAPNAGPQGGGLHLREGASALTRFALVHMPGRVPVIGLSWDCADVAAADESCLVGVGLPEVSAAADDTQGSPAWIGCGARGRLTFCRSRTLCDSVDCDKTEVLPSHRLCALVSVSVDWRVARWFANVCFVSRLRVLSCRQSRTQSY